MLDFLFSLILQLPHFRGKARVMGFFRGKLRRTYVHAVYRGLLMHIQPTEWAQFELLRGHILERKTLALYEKLLQPGDTYLDVGAHLGFHSLLARYYVGPGGRVVAAEPQPYNCNCILENARLNGFNNVAVQIAAIGDAADFVDLRLQPEIDRSILSLLDVATSDASVYFRVPVLPLRMVFEQQRIGRVRLMKIDVEGFEAAVLDGMAGIADRIEHLVVEILPAPYARADSGHVYTRLRKMGFTVWRNVEGTSVQQGDALPDNNLWASRPDFIQ